MTDSDFICGLMAQNTDALGFIPRPTIEHRFIPRDHYIIQRNRFQKRVGYLIHGPVHPDGKLYIHQTCIQLDRRNRRFGYQAVNTLIQRAIRKNARVLLLRVATDLEAMLFWPTLGFLPTRTSTGGIRRQRTLLHFHLLLDPFGVHPAPKVGFRPASCGPPPKGLTASQ